MHKSWNRTYITLIPKKDNPKKSIDYRPISLYSTTHEIVAKILVKSLQPILPSLVSMELGAFV